MQVVDGVEVHVFGVPGEGGLPHSEVEVGRVHAVDLHVVVLVHPVQNRAQILDVPMLKINEKMIFLIFSIKINFLLIYHCYVIA